MTEPDPPAKSWAQVAQTLKQPRAPLEQTLAAPTQAHSATDDGERYYEHVAPARRQALAFENFPLCFQHVCQRCGEGDHTAERCLIHKTKSCQYWRGGHCRFDAAQCNYAHDEELRKPWVPYCVGVFCGAQGEAIFAGCGAEHWFRECPHRVCVYCGDHTHHEASCPFLQMPPPEHKNDDEQSERGF